MPRKTSVKPAGPPPASGGNDRASVELYVVVGVRVKEWLEVQAEQEGLSVSAHVRRRLTLAYVASTTSSSSADA